MYWFKKTATNRTINISAIILLVFSTLFTSAPLNVAVADGSNSFVEGDGEFGKTLNEEEGKDYERAKVNKQVSHGENPGEYFIDLRIEGKDNTKIDTTDIVLVYDNSNSMSTSNRVGIARDATTQFVNQLLNDSANFQTGLITYGSVVFDGRRNTALSSSGNTPELSYKGLTTDASTITSLLPSDVPNNRGRGNDGGTFTQQGLEEAGKILANSTADNKIIVTITDGVPTFSYDSDKTSILGNGTSYTNAGDRGNHGVGTLEEANALKENYELYTLAIEIGSGQGATKAQAEQLMRDISSSPDHAYFAENVDQLVGHLNEIIRHINNSVVDGSVEDPMGEYFILQGTDNFTEEAGAYELTASEGTSVDGVNVTTDGQKIDINGLNLGEGEWVNLRYKVQIDTEADGFEADKFYRTNGETTLTPRSQHPNDKNTFPEPHASAKGIEVEGIKIWEDFGLSENRPENITVNLMRGDNKVDSTEVTPDNDGNWSYVFDNAIWYDRNGNIIDYTFSEVPVDGYEMIENNDEQIVNRIIAEPGISLEKTAISTSNQGDDVLEVGKDIDYTFTITNTGNLPLENITLTDELEGISEFTYFSLTGDDFTGNINDFVLQPNDVLVATASYQVDQADFDYGQVQNEAKVVGTPTGNDPNNPDSPQPVEDDDNQNVPSELAPSISLEKKASTETVSEVSEEVTYSFTVENTGNTTLTDVKLVDDMLGGEIELEAEHKTLLPGDKFTIERTYNVTQEDLDAGEILNNADVEGTPPPAYTSNPDNPNTVTDEDDESIEINQEPKITLVKETDKEELEVNDTITYTFTATNTGNVTLTNVIIEDILDGISDINYLSINEDVVTDPDNITLNPGDVLEATATYTVTQEDVDYGQVHNESTVTGTDPKDEEVTDEDDKWVPHEPELSIELEKTSDKQVVTEVGEEIEFTFNITNTSSVTLTNVKVSDPMLEELDIEIELNKTTLMPGETTTGKSIYTVTEADIEEGAIKNLATATGAPPNPNDPIPEDPDEVEVKVAKIDLEKSSQPGIFTEAGQEITYNLTVTNTGEVTLNNIVLEDEKLGGVIELEVDTLEPEQSTEVEVPYIVTEEDVEAKEILNTAEVTGEPTGHDPEDENSPQPVTAEDNDTVLYAALELDKTSDKEEIAEVGEILTYSFTVTNTGTVALENIEVNDPMLDELNIEIEFDESQLPLQPGDSIEATAEYTVTQEDLDKGGVKNVATVTGTPPGYDPEDPNFPDEPPVSPPSENELPADQHPNIELTKVADKTIYSEASERVKYTFTVTNTGNVTLTDVKVDDETFGLSVGLLERGSTEKFETVTLAPGESATGQYTHIVTQNNMDDGEIINIAKTEGTPPPVIEPDEPYNPIDQEPVTDEDDEQVKAQQEADLTLVKESDKENIVKAGDVITYTLSVTNTGNVTLDNVTVYDDMLGGELKVSPSTIEPGETGKATGSYEVTQEDIDNESQIENIATATGTPPGKDPGDPTNPTTPPVEENVPVTKDPAITLVKQADKEELLVGETITYTFTATNTGNQTLTNVEIIDELEGLSDITYVSINGDENAVTDTTNITLEPGDILVATATYDLTQEDVNRGELTNVAKAEGTPPPVPNPEDPDNPISQDPVTDEDDEKVPSEHKPALGLEKSSDKEEVTEAGQVITYKFVVTNTGNVTIDNVKIDDEMLEEVGIEVVLENTTLNPGEATVGYAEYIVTQEDIDNETSVKNIATTTGTPPSYDPDNPPTDPTDPGYPPVSPPAEKDVPVVKNPNIEIVKAADKIMVSDAGEEINYTFTVTNTGNVTLTEVVVIDGKLDEEIELGKTTLEPGESTTGTATYVVTQEEIDSGLVENIATTTGFPPGYDSESPPTDPSDPTYPPTDEGEEIVPVEQNPAISIEKSSDKEEVEKAGDTITYKFAVTNTGNVTLKNVEVIDEMLEEALVEVALEKTTLAPGETTTGSAEYTVTQADIDSGLIENVATATGISPGFDPENPPTDPTDPGYPPVSPPSEKDVPTSQDASINLEKSTESTDLVVGEEINYNFVVTNTGNVTLTNVSITDTLEGISDINYISINDNEITDTTSITLQPNDILVAEASYTISQTDVDNGNVENFATAKGFDPKEKEVTDNSRVTVPQEQVPSINLEKSSNIEKVTKAGQEVTYTFTVTNTGNVTISNINLDDPMLGGQINLDKNKLIPGESTSVTQNYQVTDADLDKEDIINIAIVTGSTSQGSSVDNQDDDIIPVEVEIVDVVEEIEEKQEGFTLPQTATNIYNALLLGMILLGLGATVMFVARRQRDSK